MTPAVRRVAWKCTDIAFLREHYATKGAAWCAERLPGRTVVSINSRARKAGLAQSRMAQAIRSTPQIDAVITRGYQGNRPHGFVGALAKSIERPTWWVSGRAADLGLIAPPSATRWTQDEKDFVEARPLTSAGTLAKMMRKRGWKRAPSAIAWMRSHGIIARDDPAIFTAADLARAMGVDTSIVTKWVKAGWLHATPRGTNRTDAQGGDTYIIHERDVARFVVEHVGRVNLAKIEPNKAWFVDLMARCAASTPDGIRDKGKRIAALAEQRPDLTRTQIAEMTDSTPSAVSVVLSRVRRHDLSGAQA